MVIIYNTTDDDDDEEDFMDSSAILPPGTRTYTFTDITKERNYTIEVIAINGVGSSSARKTFLGKSLLILIV